MSIPDEDAQRLDDLDRRLTESTNLLDDVVKQWGQLRLDNQPVKGFAVNGTVDAHLTIEAREGDTEADVGIRTATGHAVICVTRRQAEEFGVRLLEWATKPVAKPLRPGVDPI